MGDDYDWSGFSASERQEAQRYDLDPISYGVQRHLRAGGGLERTGGAHVAHPSRALLVVALAAAAVAVATGAGEWVARQLGAGGTCTGMLVIFIAGSLVHTVLRSARLQGVWGWVTTLLLILMAIGALGVGRARGVSPILLFGYGFASYVAFVVTIKLLRGAFTHPTPVRALLVHAAKDYRDCALLVVVLIGGAMFELIAQVANTNEGAVLTALLGAAMLAAMGWMLRLAAAALRRRRPTALVASRATGAAAPRESGPWTAQTALLICLSDLAAAYDLLELGNPLLSVMASCLACAVLFLLPQAGEVLGPGGRAKRSALALAVIALPSPLGGVGLLALCALGSANRRALSSARGRFS